MPPHSYCKVLSVHREKFIVVIIISRWQGECYYNKGRRVGEDVMMTVVCYGDIMNAINEFGAFKF